MSTFFNAAALQVGALDQDQTGLIYVSAGVEIYGSQNISNAKISSLETASSPEKISKKNPKPKYISIAKQILAKKNVEQRNLKRLQDKISINIIRSIYSSSNDRNLLALAKYKAGSSAIASTSVNFDFSNAFLQDYLILKRFESEIKKQKFYTSLSYLQFRNFRSCSLRAPPKTS